VYLSTRAGRDEEHAELGCTGHGPQAGGLIELMLRELRSWHSRHRAGPGPAFQVHGASAELPPGFHIARRYSCITVRWAE